MEYTGRKKRRLRWRAGERERGRTKRKERKNDKGVVEARLTGRNSEVREGSDLPHCLTPSPIAPSLSSSLTSFLPPLHPCLPLLLLPSERHCHRQYFPRDKLGLLISSNLPGVVTPRVYKHTGRYNTCRWKGMRRVEDEEEVEVEVDEEKGIVRGRGTVDEEEKGIDKGGGAGEREKEDEEEKEGQKMGRKEVGAEGSPPTLFLFSFLFRPTSFGYYLWRPRIPRVELPRSTCEFIDVSFARLRSTSF